MKSSFIIAALFSSMHANAQTCHSLVDLNWIKGSWASKSNNQVITENWHKVSEMTLEGVGKTYINGALKSSESMRLVEMSNALFFMAKVDHNALPVAFKLTQCGATNAVFENPNHDFPKRIEYQSVSANKLLVTVSDGKKSGFSINFERTKEASYKINSAHLKGNLTVK